MWTRKPSRPITAFRGPHRMLSNFWVCNIRFKGVCYPSSEHAYQCQKTDNWRWVDVILTSPSPLIAQREGRKTPLIKGWDRMKVRVMHGILLAKFAQNEDCRNVLMSTKGVDLIEGNNWKDTFWGECPLGTGDNYLGRLLVGIRDNVNAFDIVDAYEAQFDADKIREKELEIKSHGTGK